MLDFPVNPDLVYKEVESGSILPDIFRMKMKMLDKLIKTATTVNGAGQKRFLPTAASTHCMNWWWDGEAASVGG